jgi:site-specific DNA-methyltransferase (adenine-specific)
MTSACRRRGSLVYGDKRAEKKGRIPDDTWILRPQDAPESFTADEDVWYFSRVCGTFSERAGWHGCQMPEQVLGRIIKVVPIPAIRSSIPSAAAGQRWLWRRKLGRRFIGFELSKNYAKQIRSAAQEHGAR